MWLLVLGKDLLSEVYLVRVVALLGMLVTLDLIPEVELLLKRVAMEDGGSGRNGSEFDDFEDWLARS